MPTEVKSATAMNIELRTILPYRLEHYEQEVQTSGLASTLSNAREKQATSPWAQKVHIIVGYLRKFISCFNF